MRRASSAACLLAGPAGFLRPAESDVCQVRPRLISPAPGRAGGGKFFRPRPDRRRATMEGLAVGRGAASPMELRLSRGCSGWMSVAVGVPGFCLGPGADIGDRGRA